MLLVQRISSFVIWYFRISLFCENFCNRCRNSSATVHRAKKKEIQAEKQKKNSIFFFSIMSFNSISCFLHQNSYAVQVLLLFSVVLRVPLFFAGVVVVVVIVQCFLEKKEKNDTLYHIIADDFTLYHSSMRKHFCYTFKFFSVFVQFFACQNEMFNKPNDKKQKLFTCDVFFFWPLPPFFAPKTLFIYGEWIKITVKKKEEKKWRNETVLFTDRLCDLVYICHSKPCVCVKRTNVLDPGKKIMKPNDIFMQFM